MRRNKENTHTGRKENIRRTGLVEGRWKRRMRKKKKK